MTIFNKVLLAGIFVFLNFLLIGKVYACGTVPTADISSNPSSCSSFSPSCNVTITWNVTCNEDGDPASMFHLQVNGSTQGTGYSGTVNASLTGESTIRVFKDSFGDVKSITVGSAPTSTPTPTLAPTAYPQYRVCNSPCGNNNECASGLQCINYLCRLPSNPNDSSCSSPSYGGSGSSSNPTATPTTKPAGSTAVSSSSTANVLSAQTTATPTPTSSSTNDEAVLGESTVVVTPEPTSAPKSGNSLVDVVKNYPLASAVVGVIVLGSVGFLIKFRKDLAVF